MLLQEADAIVVDASDDAHAVGIGIKEWMAEEAPDVNRSLDVGFGEQDQAIARMNQVSFKEAVVMCEEGGAFQGEEKGEDVLT